MTPPIRTINIDLDNVVADFESHYTALTGLRWADGKDAITRWQPLAGKENSFFLDMPPFAGSIAFVEEITRKGAALGLAVRFLTALPVAWSFPTAVEDKTAWVPAKLNSSLPVAFGPYAPDKAKHCKPGDILIDDNHLNIKQWNEAGGFGILHTSFEKSMTELHTILMETI